MNFKHFNLKEAQEKLFTFPTVKKRQVDRRKFIKTMSFSALAINPVSSSIDKLDNVFSDSFRIQSSEGGFVVKRKNKICWKYPAPHFVNDEGVIFQKVATGYELKMKNLQLNGSQQTFDVLASIYEGIFGWRMKIQIPLFSVDQDVKFSDWLDGKVLIESETDVELLFGNIEGENSLHIKGDVNFRMDNRWNMYFEGKDAVKLYYSGKYYFTSVAMLSNRGQVYKSCITAPSQALKVTLPAFSSLPEFIADFKFSNHYSLQAIGKNPDVNMLIWNDKIGKFHQSLWINHEGESLALKHDFQEKHNFKFQRYFLLSETNEQQQPGVYLAAASSPNQWFSNSIGAFLIGSNGSIPELEAFGQGTQMHTYRYAPRLTAFRPVIDHALTLPTVMDEVINIVVAHSYNSNNVESESFAFTANADTTTNRTSQQNKLTNQNRQKRVSTISTTTKTTTTTNREELQKQTPQDRKRKVIIEKVTQPEVTKPQEKQDRQDKPKRIIRQPEISVDKNDLLFKPENLKFRVLRPEDLLLLEFEFRNFVFSLKGSENVAELQNKKNKGTVIVWIQTQHTLEEAFFEENELPKDVKAPPSSGVTLPVKHMRAYRSRLVFEYPAGGEPFKLNINELLDWSKFELRVHPRAWINVPKKGEFGTISKQTKGRVSAISILNKNKATEIDTKKDIGYSIKLNQTNSLRLERDKVYESSTVKKVFESDVAGSLLDDNVSKRASGLIMKPGPIPEDSTCIEAPTLMYMSPNQTGGFIHRISLPQLSTSDEASNTSGEIYELWHTKLGVRVKGGKVINDLPELRTLRALWAFDANEKYDSLPNVPFSFLSSLDESDRHILVHTTSNYDIRGYAPATIPVNKLMLTPLGAYLDWHAFFDVPAPADSYLNILEWQHLATLGRDHYVKIVKEGYLFPFGHRAALVKVTERKFMKENRSAVNRQHMYIVVLQPEFIYPRTIPQGNFLEFPFQSVEIATTRTPNIDNPTKTTVSSAISGKNFYIYSSGAPFNFDLVLTDKDGGEHKCRLPLTFVENIVGRNKSHMQAIIHDYANKPEYNNLKWNGENISYAESLIDGDTLYETREMSFGGIAFDSPGVGEICFRPTMQHALIKLDAVNKLTGNDDPVKIKLVDDANAGHVFASVENALLDFSGGSDKSGGFLTPNMSITGLSRLFGTVGGPIDDAMNMLFNAAKVFEEIGNLTSPKIFGVIKIFSLFDTDIPDFKGSMDGFINQAKALQAKISQLKDSIKMAEAEALEAEKTIRNDLTKTKSQIENEINKIKKDLEKQINDIADDIKNEVANLRKQLENSIPRIPNLKTYLTDDAFHAQYKWQPDLGGSKKEVFPGLLTVNISDPKKALQIDTHFEKPFNLEAAPKFSTVARFDKFNVEVAECIAVNFESLRFESGTSGKSGVKVDLGKVPMQFTGALSFINNLNDVIPSSGFSDDGNGPYLELTASGVKAGYTLALPNIELGMCMVSNVSLGAFINLPFTGAPMTIGFYFCKRENPFMLTISCFGGGGFIQLITRLDGLESIEAAFEFGAAISINVGVASGGVSVMGGIYFKSTSVQKELPNEEIISYTQADISAYLRINGRLSILGLIHISLEFYLELHAVIADGRVQKLEGSATLKVKVSVLFFSKTVSVTVRRTLAGSGGDPNFAQMISPDDWEQYCLAFA